ncbi:glycosyltransferase family 4 protein [Acidisoma sp.]|uniref:glycosyltransferase family 4 protein n=1 Tax=Acidisoma sp. TaxID=1872115 RepID=UPI003B00F063
MTVTFFIPGDFPPTTGAIVFDTQLAEQLRSLGQDVTMAPVAGAHPGPDAAARASARELWRAHRGRRPDDLPVIDGFCLYAFDGLEEHLQRAGAVGMVHHLMSLEPQLSEAERDCFAAIERRVLPRLARIVVPSETTRSDVLAALAVPPKAVDVVTPGIAQAARSIGSGGRICRLLAIGSLIPRKGHDTVLRALAGLPDLDWMLTICGDGGIDPAHAAALQSLVEETGLADRVVFAGACAPDQLEALWRNADIFVSGSRFEGYGMAVAEAVRRGLPLAVTKGAAAPEVIPNEGSVIVDSGDFVQLSKGLRRLVFSLPLRQALAEAAWQAGRAFPTWAEQGTRFAKLLTAS